MLSHIIKLAFALQIFYAVTSAAPTFSYFLPNYGSYSGSSVNASSQQQSSSSSNYSRNSFQGSGGTYPYASSYPYNQFATSTIGFNATPRITGLGGLDSQSQRTSFASLNGQLGATGGLNYASNTASNTYGNGSTYGLGSGSSYITNTGGSLLNGGFNLNLGGNASLATNSAMGRIANYFH